MYLTDIDARLTSDISISFHPELNVIVRGVAPEKPGNPCFLGECHSYEFKKTCSDSELISFLQKLTEELQKI